MANKKQNDRKVPNLRFPGFEMEWVEKKLGDIATFSKGKGISKNEIEENGKNECVRYGELYTHYGEVIDEIKSRTNTKLSNLVLSEANDVIIPASGETTIDIATASCVIKSGVALGGDLNIIKTLNNGVFLSYYLNSKSKLAIANLAQGISVVHLYSSQLKLLFIKLPAISEQHKIASFLSLLNERISTQSKIIKNLETLINEARNGIFSQKLCFENSTTDWLTKRFSKVYVFKSTNSLSREKLNYEIGTIKNIHYGDIHTKFKTLFDSRKEYVPYINDSVPLERISEEHYLKEGDMVFADASEDLNDVGKSIEIVNLNSEKILSGLHTILARPYPEVFIFGFGGHLFRSKRIRLQIQREAQGTKVLSISASRLLGIEIPIPSFKEQAKIASFLSLIESKIEAETSIFEKLELQKKYLLQQIFV